MNADTKLKLAPPGAGLPKFELFIGRLLFALRRRTGNRDSLNAQFTAEREKIRRLIQACDAASLARRVLIARPRGLEDSSRCWSVLMTLDHLRIVNSAITRIIIDLAAGRLPEGVASTAAVKPSEEAMAGVIAEFEDSCDALLGAVAAAGDLKTPLRYAHPWFGPLDAHGWHALAASHLGIHRVQIERIISGFSGSSPL